MRYVRHGREFLMIAVIIWWAVLGYRLNRSIPRPATELKCPQLVDVPKDILTDALNRNLDIETSGGHASGVNVGDGYFLTALHVVINPLYDNMRKYGDKEITIDDNDVHFTLIKDSDTTVDMALLKSGNLNRVSRRLSCYSGTLELNTPVFAVGNPKDDLDLVTTGTIVADTSNYGPDGFVADTQTAAGSSGGGLYNALTGQLIGIVQRTDGKRMYGHRCTNFMPAK